MTNTRQQRNRLLMESRTFLEERVVHHTEFPDISYLLTQEGCFSFIDLEDVIYPSLVREFYANLNISIPDQISFRLFNTPYSWPLTEFALIMGIPSNGHSFYTPRTDLRSLDPLFPIQIALEVLTDSENLINLNQRILLQDADVCNDLQLLLTVVRHNFFCREASATHISGTEVAIMWSLLAHEPINFAYLMTQRMGYLRDLPNRPLPYPNHLNRLFRHAHAITPFLVPQPVSTTPITFWVDHQVLIISSDTEESTISDAISTNNNYL